MTICKPCSVAADLVSVWRDREDEREKLLYVKDVLQAIPFTNFIAPLASRLHSLCHNCDCQHKLDWEGKTVAVQKQSPREVPVRKQAGGGETFLSNDEEYKKLAGESRT